MPEKTDSKYYFLYFGGCAAAAFQSEGCAEKNKIVFCFVFDTGTQSIAVSVTRYVLLHSLTAPGPSCRPPCRPAFMCVLLSITTGTLSMEQWSHGAPRLTRNTGYYAVLSFQNNLSCAGCKYVVLASIAEYCMDL